MRDKSKGTVFITGGAQRIGHHVALSLSRAGYTIALHYHTSIEAAQKTAREIKKKGGRCHLFPCDLANEIRTQKLIRSVQRECPDLNVLINNASIFEKSTLDKYNLDSLNRHFVINFIAPYILTAEFAKVCRKGSIINFLDTHVTGNRINHFDYLLSKKTLSEMTKMAAVALAPHIRVNAVAPGLILAPRGKGKDHLERLAKNIPLQRRGNVDNISAAVEFLIADNYITGHTVFCDGGEHLK